MSDTKLDEQKIIALLNQAFDQIEAEQAELERRIEALEDHNWTVRLGEKE